MRGLFEKQRDEMQIVAPRIVPAADSNTTRLATWIHGFAYDDLPENVSQFAKGLVLDTIAVAWAANSASGMQAALDTVLAEGGASLSTLWGSPHRLGPGAAAFYNSALASALDYDSLHERGGVHSDAVVVPAALAVGETRRVDGRNLLASYVAASELNFRLGRATLSTSGWFRTSVYGVFAAAAASAKLLGLDAAQTQHALGIALSLASGTQQPNIERKLTKRLQSAFAARSGVFAAQLASRGITAPDAPFDGKFSLYALYDEGDPTQAFGDLGEVFLLTDTVLKKFPSCACTHAAIQATLDLQRDHALTPDDIEQVEVILTPYMHRLVGAPFSLDGDLEVTAQFSVQYTVATALLRGAFTAADLSPEHVRDTRVHALIAKIKVSIDEASSGRLSPATVIITAIGGRQRTGTVTALPGGLDLPLSPKELRHKAASAFATGQHALAPSKVSALIDRIENLERVRDVSKLFEGIVANSLYRVAN